MFLDETWTPLFHLKTSFFNGHCYPALIWFNPRKSYFPNNFWVIFFVIRHFKPRMLRSIRTGCSKYNFFYKMKWFFELTANVQIKNKQFFQERILTNLFSHGLKNLKKCKAFEWVSAWAKLFTFHNLRQKQMKKKKLL